MVHNGCKRDLKQVKDAAKKAGISEYTKEYGDYIEEIKKMEGKRNDANFTFKQLLEIAEEFKEMMGL